MLTFKPSKIPLLQLRLVDFEIVGGSLLVVAFLFDGEGKAFVGFSVRGLGAVDGRVNLDSDIEKLTGKEVGSAIQNIAVSSLSLSRVSTMLFLPCRDLLVWWENTTYFTK